MVWVCVCVIIVFPGPSVVCVSIGFGGAWPNKPCKRKKREYPSDLSWLHSPTHPPHTHTFTVLDLAGYPVVYWGVSTDCHRCDLPPLAAVAGPGDVTCELLVLRTWSLGPLNSIDTETLCAARRDDGVNDWLGILDDNNGLMALECCASVCVSVYLSVCLSVGSWMLINSRIPPHPKLKYRHASCLIQPAAQSINRSINQSNKQTNRFIINQPLTQSKQNKTKQNRPPRPHHRRGQRGQQPPSRRQQRRSRLSGARVHPPGHGEARGGL